MYNIHVLLWSHVQLKNKILISILTCCLKSQQEQYISVSKWTLTDSFATEKRNGTILCSKITTKLKAACQIGLYRETSNRDCLRDMLLLKYTHAFNTIVLWLCEHTFTWANNRSVSYRKHLCLLFLIKYKMPH